MEKCFGRNFGGLYLWFKWYANITSYIVRTPVLSSHSFWQGNLGPLDMWVDVLYEFPAGYQYLEQIEADENAPLEQLRSMKLV